MLAALPVVAIQAIDYSCTEAALEEIQREMNHLRAFCQDVGLDYQVGGQVYASELWEMLKQWYLDNGYLEYVTDAKGKQKPDWSDLPRRRDTLVKACHQVRQRFLDLFPKAAKGKENGHHPTHPNYKFLSGLGFGEPYNNVISSMGTLSPSVYLKSVGVETFLSNLEPQQLQEMWTKMHQQGSQDSHPCQEGVEGFPEGSRRVPH